MPAAAERMEFAPPPQPGLMRGFTLAIIAHLLLLAGLTAGVKWQREVEVVSAEAELWARLPQEAAPREAPAPPPPPPAPVVQAPPKPEPPVQREAQIAVEREKEKRLEAERREAELERRERDKRQQEARRQREEDQADRRAEQKAALEAKRRDEEKKKQLQELQAAKQREDNLKRMQGMATGSGAEDARGTAAVSSGPSASWGGRVQARVRPNIVFTDDVSGNPKADVEVRLAPDGTIVGKRLVKSSGVRAWDEAVMRALDKTEVLPRDVDGRVPSSVTIGFSPRN